MRDTRERLFDDDAGIGVRLLRASGESLHTPSEHPRHHGDRRHREHEKQRVSIGDV